MLLWKRRVRSPGGETLSMRGHGGRQLLHRVVVGPRRMHACLVAAPRGPPTLRLRAAGHRSTSSSPGGGGAGPRRPSSLPCFLLAKQRTRLGAPNLRLQVPTRPAGLFTQPLLVHSLPPFPCLHKLFKGGFVSPLYMENQCRLPRTTRNHKNIKIPVNLPAPHLRSRGR